MLFFGVHLAKPVVWFNSKPSGYFRTLYSGFIVLSSEALNCIYTVLFTSTLIEVFPVMLGDSFSLTKFNCVHYFFKVKYYLQIKLPWVWKPWVNPEQTPKENLRLRRGLISFRLGLIGILYMLSSNNVCLFCLMLIIAIQGIKLTYYIYNYTICLIHVWSLDRIFDTRNIYTNHSNRTHWTTFLYTNKNWSQQNK